MDRLTMEELIKYMNECEEEFFITVELNEEEIDAEKVECGVN